MDQPPDDITIAHEGEVRTDRLLEGNRFPAQARSGTRHKQQLFFHERNDRKLGTTFEFIGKRNVKFTAQQRIDQDEAQLLHNPEGHIRNLIAYRRKEFGSDQRLNAGRDAKIDDRALRRAIGHHVPACILDRAQNGKGMPI